MSYAACAWFSSVVVKERPVDETSLVLSAERRSVQVRVSTRVAVLLLHSRLKSQTAQRFNPQAMEHVNRPETAELHVGILPWRVRSDVQ